MTYIFQGFTRDLQVLFLQMLKLDIDIIKVRKTQGAKGKGSI